MYSHQHLLLITSFLLSSLKTDQFSVEQDTSNDRFGPLIFEYLTCFCMFEAFWDEEPKNVFSALKLPQEVVEPSPASDPQTTSAISCQPNKPQK